MGTPGQEKPGELRINLRLKPAESDSLEQLMKYCWPQAKSRARAIRTAIDGYPRAMDALEKARGRIEYLEAALHGLLAAEDAMTSAQEMRQAGMEEVRRRLGMGDGKQ